MTKLSAPETSNNQLCVLWSEEEPSTALIKFPYFDFSFINEIKETVPSKERKYDPATKQWTLMITALSTRWLQELNKLVHWDIPDVLLSYVQKNEKDAEETVLLSEALSSDLDVQGVTGELLPFQAAAVEYATKKKRVLIADDMGLGKTLESLATLAHIDSLSRVVVVCPAIAKLTWREEINHWLPDVSVHVTGARNTDDMITANIVILSYNQLDKQLDNLLARNNQAVIYDESHYLKNEKSQRTKNAKKLADSVPVRILLSGTPVLNRPFELISQLDILGYLKSHFGGFWNFVNTYCEAEKTEWGWNFNGAANLDELNQHLRQTCMIRRLKRDVLKDLPLKRRSKVTIPLTNPKTYNHAYNKLLQATQRLEDVQTQERGEQKSTKSVNEVVEAAQNSLFASLSALRHVIGKGKIKASVEWILDFAQTDQPLVVFAHHVDVQKALFEALEKKEINVDHIFGQDSSQHRFDAVKRFQNKDTQILICSLHGANTNITLTAASNVLFVEMDWKPTTHQQAEDRVLRIGADTSLDAINIYYLAAEDTLDDSLWSTLSRKMVVIEQAIDGEQAQNEVFDINIQKAVLKQLSAKR